MTTFCTIVTNDYLPLAKTLYDSLRKWDESVLLHVLSIDNNPEQPDGNIKLVQLNDLSSSKIFTEIHKKYAHTNSDVFRWALKPVIIGHLLEQGYEKVIFNDADLFYVNDFSFIPEQLDTYSVLLTPHWADLDIVNSEDNLLSVLRNGMFNAGFVAASYKGLPAINWWAAMCSYKMERRKELGIYDDQRYLDILPVQFTNVQILRHRGCNLASWNIQSNKREIVNGRLLINREFEPVFIHFAKDTIENILNKNDVLLKPYLDEYVQLLSDNGFELFESQGTFYPEKYETAFYGLKHKIRLRTRIKRFLFKLAEKL